MTDITIMMLTRGEPFAERFVRDAEKLAIQLDAQLLIGIDGDDAQPIRQWLHPAFEPHYSRHLVTVRSNGYLESVHDELLSHVGTRYVLRLDDDERPGQGMRQWLIDRKYREHDHWKFPRMALFQDEDHFLIHPQLWPDHQTRLSVKNKAGGRTRVHCGSPYGGGHACPYGIEHWKFLVKSADERRRLAAHYDAYHPGYGTGGMLVFNVPEDAVSPPDLQRFIRPLYAEARDEGARL